MRCFCCCALGIRTDAKKKSPKDTTHRSSLFLSCSGEPCFGTAFTARSTPLGCGAFRNKDLGTMMMMVVMMMMNLLLVLRTEEIGSGGPCPTGLLPPYLPLGTVVRRGKKGCATNATPKLPREAPCAGPVSPSCIPVRRLSPTSDSSASF